MTALPILWSFRRCPYAIRARLALDSAKIRVELREILLRAKPEAFLQTSASATVPALAYDGGVLDESLEIMVWALRQHDPEGLLAMPEAGWTLIETCDGPFKTALDHTKYAARFPERDRDADREKAAASLADLDARLQGRLWLFGASASLADLAILPFVRQFANVDRDWFDARGWADLAGWLDRFLESAAFARVMPKFAPWAPGDAPVCFGG